MMSAPSPWLESRSVRFVGGLALAALAWLSFADAVSQSLGKTAPQIVMRLGTPSPDALNAMAGTAAATQTPAARERARMLALRSIAVSPLNPVALRLLGASWQNGRDNRQARPFFVLSEGTSRRDLGTQLFFVMENARLGNKRETVARIDTALRTSENSRDMLFPILGKIVETPDGRDALATLIPRTTPWLPDFLAFALDSGVKPDPVGRFVVRLGDIPDGPGRPELENSLFRLLESHGEYDLLASIMPRLKTVPRGAVASAAIDEVTLAPDWEPLTWKMASEAGISVGPVTSADGKSDVLGISLSGGLSGEAARKLLMLRPGRYNLAIAQSFDSNADGTRTDISSTWTLSCLEGGVRRTLWENASVNSKLATTFQVGPACHMQELSLNVAAGMNADQAGMTVGPIVITPLR